MTQNKRGPLSRRTKRLIVFETCCVLVLVTVVILNIAVGGSPAMTALPLLTIIVIAFFTTTAVNKDRRIRS